ncbi:hypothetical protein Sjap_018740 [Stephania japonica]|uniref:Protein LNK1 n=1 Tax=Stephania japonica TaxID=461633 RepID=A0AAP0NLW1_9MAGN
MSDWSMYELEDIAWDEIGETDDHIVPHPSGEKYSSKDVWSKKPRCEVVSATKKSASFKSVAKDVFQGKKETVFPTLKGEEAAMLDKGPWSRTPDGIFPGFSDTENMKDGSSLTSNDGNLSDNCFKSTEMDSLSTGFCEDDASLSNKGTTIESSLCRFPLGDMSPTDDELKFFGGTHDEKESSDLLYYGWPDIGNFEDVDRMFRSCDSTFGIGSSANNDELSWLSSSSHALNDSDDSLRAGFKSSYFESSALKNTSKYCEVDTNLISDDLKPSVSEGKSITNTSSGSQANVVSGEVEFKISPAQTFSGNNGHGKLQRKQSKHPHQSEGKRKDRSSEYAIDRSFRDVGKMKQSQQLPNSSSVKQVAHSPDSVQQNNSVQSDSVGYLGTFNPYVNVNYNCPTLQTPVTQTTSCNKSGDNSSTSLITSKTSFAANHTMPLERPSAHLLGIPPKNSEQKVEKFGGQHQVQSNGNIFPQQSGSVVHGACAKQIPFQKQWNQSLDDFTGRNSADGEGIETLAEVDSSIAQESSCMSSVLSDDFSLEATSFRQLQHVTQKLDIRTKLCIRDSLYRLARNAEQRHNLRNLDSSSRDNSGLHTTDDSNRSAGFMDFETNTNPIDRSIAHLLFHRSSDPCTRPANDALSLESRTIILGSTTGQLVMPEKLVHEEESASGDTKLLVSD